MPPVRSLKNQYRGINAHLHSYWQDVRGWNNFHNPYIVHLAEALKAQLRPLGYIAELEDSIQIRRFLEYERRPESDITIYDLNPSRVASPHGEERYALSGMVFPLNVVLETNPVSEKPYSAVVVYETDRIDSAEPVAWIEVLSPSNKRRGADRDSYLAKRDDVLEAGIVFVEIDYLHEMSPTLPLLPNYSALEKQAHPYRILVFDPRPELESGRASINEFDVDQPIPEIILPLSGNDRLSFDAGIPYQRLFALGFLGDYVDYRQFPANFDRYSPADQRRIALRMLAVLEAAREGVDLDAAAPLPVKDLSLEEAVRAVEGIREQISS